MDSSKDKPKEAIGFMLAGGIAYFAWAVLFYLMDGSSVELFLVYFSLCGIALLSLACGLYIKPIHCKKFGTVAIVISLAGLASPLSAMLGFVGGMSAVFAYKPVQKPLPAKPFSALSIIVCSNCGYKNPTEFEFCGRCGTLLKEEETRIY